MVQFYNNIDKDSDCKKQILPVKIPILKPGDLLHNKVAIVTGGASGIGYDIARQFVTNGCKVYIISRNEQKLKSAASELGCHYRVLDISIVKDIDGVVNDIFKKNDVDILVNAAGALAGKHFGQTDLESWNRVFDTNARGTYFMTQTVTNKMKERCIKGHVLNLSSSSALRPGWTVYNISKQVIRDITVGMAKELIPFGIIVNAIAPGPTATSMLNANENDISNPNVPVGRFATVEEISNLALYMVGEMGNLIVGSTVYITGGCGTIE